LWVILARILNKPPLRQQSSFDHPLPIGQSGFGRLTLAI
jgi:hypothetical protein